MKGAGFKVGLTAVVVAVIGWIAFRFVAKGIQGDQGYEVWALFKDATGLVDKSRVQIAGLVVGDLRERRLQYDAPSKSTLARVTVRMKSDLVLWSNAAVYKRSASLLGEFYLEIDPGTPESPDAATGKALPNYPLKGCRARTGVADCNQIKNVIEAVTTTDILVQVSETLPILRDILHDVHNLTQGPLNEMVKEVQSGIKSNSSAVEKLLSHLDEIAQDLHTVTSPRGVMFDDLRESMANIRHITESINQLVGSGEGQMNSTGDKLKKDLDDLSVTLAKLNHSIDQVSDLAGKVSEGQGTVGKLLTDDRIAKNVTDMTEDAAGFLRQVTRLQTVVEIDEQYNVMGNSFKTYLNLKLQPRPDKYYLVSFIDDPRGSRTYSHTLQTTTPLLPNGMPGPPTTFNVDTWNRTPAFRFSVMFAKRIAWKGVGLTGRLGIEESTGGFGADVDLFKQRLKLTVDMFDFATEPLPRLKAYLALEVFKHVWLTGGLDDVLNRHTDTLAPADISCGPSTPRSWCQGGFDYFFGARLSFNDEDLRALLAIGGTALVGGGTATR